MAANNVKITATFQDNASASVASLNAAVKQLNATAAQLGAQTAGVNSFNAALKTTGDVGKDAMDKLSLGTAGASREIIVLGHEMLTGNFSRIPGSLMVLGERTNALQSVMSGLASLGPVLGSALGVVSAAAIATGVAFYQANRDAHEFIATLAATNNYAGLTSSSFAMMASKISTSTQASFGEATTVLRDLAATGKFTGQELTGLSQVIINQSILEKKAVGDVAKEFEKLPDGVTKWMNSYNASHNIFTPAQQEEIKLLEDTGRAEEARLIAQRAIAEYQKGPMADALREQKGLLFEIAGAWGEIWKAFKLGVGAEKLPLTQQIDELTTKINGLRAAGKDKENVSDAGGNTIVQQSEEWTKLIALRRSLIDKLNKEQQTALEESTNAWKSKQYQETEGYFTGLGVKSAHALQNELDKFNAEVAKRRAISPNAATDPKLDPEYLRQAEEAIRAKFRNPIDDSAARKQYQAKIAQIDGYVKEATDAYTNLNAGIKERLAAGVIDQKQAADATEALKKSELEKQYAFTQQKLALADAEVKRTNGRDALTAVVQYNEELKHLHSEMELAGIEHDIKVDEADKKALDKKKAILAELTRIDAQIAAEAMSTQAQFNKEMAKITMTADEAALNGKLDSVKSKFESMRTAAKAFFAKENSDPTALVNALQKIQDAEQKETDQTVANFKTKKAAEEDWKTGAIKAYNDYQAAASNQAKNFQTLMNSITSGLESSIENFLTTGKLSLASLEQSFTQTINKMVAQALAAKLQQALFGGLTGGSGNWATSGLGMIGAMFGGGRAAGGSVEAGKIYQVNEQGPEFFKPSVSGQVIPMGQMKSQSNGTTVHLAINAVDAPSFRNLVQSDGRFIADLVNKTTRAYNLGV